MVDSTALKYRRASLAERFELLLSGVPAMNLLIVYWLALCGLGLMNYVLGTLIVTYSPVEGLDKQVGFIWSPTLTILPIIVFPLFIFHVSALNNYWKNIGRSSCVNLEQPDGSPGQDVTWETHIRSFNFSFWAITLFCILFVWWFQWGAIYLPAYLSGDPNGVQVDRYLVALFRPEIISVPQAMFLSFVGYSYTASYIVIFMAGLLFQVIIAIDYHHICNDVVAKNCGNSGREIRKEGQRVVWGCFRTAVFGLWLATILKLQIAYLSSDSPDFITWIVTDALALVSLTESRNGFLNNTSFDHFTTFLMMAVTVSVLIFVISKVHSNFNRLRLYEDDFSFSRDGYAVSRMLLVVAIISFNLVGIGQFVGFSWYLALCVFVSLHMLTGPSLGKE